MFDGRLKRQKKTLPTVTYVLHGDVQQQLGHHGDDRQYEESSQRVNGPHWRERGREREVG